MCQWNVSTWYPVEGVYATSNELIKRFGILLICTARLNPFPDTRNNPEAINWSTRGRTHSNSEFTAKQIKVNQSRYRPAVAQRVPSRKLRFPDFMTTAQGGGKVVSLTHRPPLPPGNEFTVLREIYGECNSCGAFVHFNQHGTKDLFPQVH